MKTINLKKKTKNIVRSVINFFIRLPIRFVESYTKIVSAIHPSLANMIYSLGIELIDKRKSSIQISKEKSLILFTPNSVCKMRADTFFSKEPETIEWIQEFSTKENRSGPILIDIGGNIGIYSIFNSLKFGNKSLIFEPSPLNIKQLFKNININKVSDLCHVSTMPLSNTNSINTFNISSLEDGGALSGFGVDYGFDGKYLETIASVKTAGITLDKYIELFYPIKEHETFIVKLDVDGIEHLILSGAKKTLKNKNCLSVCVEVNEDFEEQKNDIESLLTEYGFDLKVKKQSLMSKNSNLFSTSYNYIYLKK